MLTLKVKHWQAFLFNVLALLLINFTLKGDPLSTGLLIASGFLLHFGWFAVLGNSIAPSLPPDTGYSPTWFWIDIFFVIISWAGIAILTDSHGYQGTGLAALPIFYLLFAMVHIPWFLAATVVAIEKQRKPEFGFYFGTLLMFVFWPVGVWFVQPRLNKIHDSIKSNAARPNSLP